MTELVLWLEDFFTAHWHSVMWGVWLFVAALGWADVKRTSGKDALFIIIILLISALSIIGFDWLTSLLAH